MSVYCYNSHQEYDSDKLFLIVSKIKLKLRGLDILNET